MKRTSKTPKKSPRKPRKTARAPAAPPIDPHVAKGLEYCRKVLDGSIPAGKYVRLACKRHLDDLERARTDPEYPFEFSEARAGRAARFLEQLPHVKGPKAGQLLQLALWQCFVVTCIFGWVRKSTGARRFRRAHVEVPRGNGKSFLASGIALYGLAADREEGAEVYSAATTTAQASIVHSEAEKMLRKRPVLLEKLGLQLSQHAIFQRGTNSTFSALSREAKNHDGKNIHLAVVDELHAHPTRDLWDVLITGAAKRPQSLIFDITTAGTNVSGICYEVRDGVVKMLEGQRNDALFGIIYSIDESEGDDWKTEAAWIKANPGWFDSIDHDAFRIGAVEAIQTASKENNFKTKHLNIWCNADVAWMKMSAWDKCADPNLTEAEFGKAKCFDGLDLASKVDLAARAKVFFKDIEQPTEEPKEPEEPKERTEDAPRPAAKTKRHYYLFTQSFLPEAQIEEARNAQYSGWEKEGRIITTPGDTLDFEAVRECILSDQKAHDLREVAFDPWQAQQLANELAEEGLVMVEVRPTVQNFSEPMKELELLVREGRIHHDGNPVMRWMVSNVVCHTDAKGNIYPRKQRPENKIDGVVASLMALNRAMLAPPEARSYLEDGGGVIELG